MAKQLNVSLAFTADTSKAKAELQDLQKQLTQLTNAPVSNSGKGFFLTKEIQEASAAAADLKIKLQQATDINTGKLDLNKFDESLRQSGTSLKTYREALSNLGPAGDKAFASLATSIMKADVPLRTTNKLLNEFKTTLMNTARWQISSSILHGFMGSLQSAYGYAQDLNQSLNNIRIVTGYNSDQMAKFAEQANKAAQSLSTTTTKYTDAALIYYQQGLSDEEVLGRAETTIKLANVSRQSTEEVSDQLTAIWNNFYDGSQSLEYYADVITALGAATASSSEEISNGLQKFAAVSQTVGLSYEYATAALATITATTRESADTVGNGLRTLFTRLEGLKLGETLEDGVDLNKYSAALSAVGVQILDTSGELRNMDDILEDLGAKWQQLGRDQKMALAQTVGGVRQYNNLIALMDNWDFMQENLAIARGSEGALQEQADIYAESWEAAQKRVRAAAEEIYQELLNDDFFITLLDGFKEVLDIINSTIDAIGGLKGVLIAIGAIVTNLFQKEIASEINRIGQNIRIATGQAAQATAARKAEAAQEMQQMTANSVDENTGNAMSTVYTQQGQLQQELINNASRLSAERQKELQNLLDINAVIGQNVIKAGEEADAAERKLAADQKSLALKMSRNASNDPYKNFEVNAYADDMKSFGKMSAGVSGLGAAFKEAKIDANQIQVSLQNVNSTIDRLSNEASVLQFDNAEGAAYTINEKILEVQNIIESITNKSSNTLEGTKADADDLYNRFVEIEALIEKASNSRYQDASQIGTNAQEVRNLQNLGEQAEQVGEQIEHSRQQVDQFSESSEDLNEKIKKPTVGMTNFGQQAAATAQTITTTVMVINNLVNAFKTLSDPDLSTFEKITGILSSIAMTVPMVISTLATVKTTFVATGVAAGEAGATAATAGTVAAAGWSAVLGPLALVAIGIAAITAALFGLIKAWENFTPEGKLAKAKQEAEKTKKVYEEAKNAVNEFKSQYKDWSSLYAKTQELTEGTQEYIDAMREANEEAMALIQKYDLLQGKDWHFDEKGNIVIDSDRKDKELKLEQDKTYVENLKANSKTNNTNIDTQLSQVYGNSNNYKKVDVEDSFGNRVRSNNEYILKQSDIKDLATQYAKGQINQQQLSELVAAGIQSFENKHSTVDQHGNRTVKKEYDVSDKQEQGLISAIIGLSNTISQSNSLNNTNQREIDLAEARMKLNEDEKYEFGMDPYLNKYYQKKQGYDSVTKENFEYDNADQIAAQYKKINELMSSISSEDIDDQTKQQVSHALLEAILSGETPDFSDIDTSGWSDALIAKFGDLADEVQAGIDKAANTINLDKVTQTFNVVDSIAEELDKTNSISADNYNKLTEAQQAYFKDMGDGTYYLIGEAQNFIDTVKKNALQDSIDSLEQSRAQEATVNRISDKTGEKESYLWDSDYQTSGEFTKIRASHQVDALQAVGADTSQWEDKISSGGMTADDYAKLTEEVYKYKDALLELANSNQDFDKNQQNILNNLAKEVTSLQELQNFMQSAQGNNDAYSIGLTNLALQYDNCEAELNNYAKALETHDDKLIETAQNELELAIAAGETAKKAGYEGKEFEKLTKEVKNLSDANKIVSRETQRSEKDLTDVAKAVKQTQEGINKLSKGWKSWQEDLKGKDELKKINAMSDLKDALADVMDISDELDKYGITLGDHFGDYLLENMDKVEAASNGDRDAILDLQQVATEDILIQLGFDETADAELFSHLDSTMDLIRSKIDDGSLKVGAVDDADLIASLNQMLTAVGTDVDAAQKILAGLGFNATFVEGQADENDQYWVPAKYGTKPIPTGGEEVSGSFNALTIEEPGHWESIPATKTTQALKIDTLNYTGGGNVSGSKGGSGGGRRGGGGGRRGGGSRGREFRKIDRNEKDEKKKKKVEDEIERYHKVRNELQDIEKELSLIGKAKDRAFGRNKIRQIDAETASLKKQSETQKKYLSEIQGWLEKDNAKAKEFGFEINGEGLVTNYEENMKKLIDKVNGDYDDYIAKLNALEDAYNAAGVDDEDSKKKFEDDKKALAKEWEANQKYYEDAKEALSKQEETHDLLIEQQEALQDMLNNIYDNGITKITYVVELKVDVADRDIALLQDYLEDIGDKADGACDAIANFGNQLEKVLEKTDAYTQGVADILQHADADEDLIDSILNHTFDENDWDEVLSIGQDGKGLNEEEIQYLKDAADALLSHNQELRELREQALEKTSEAFEEFNEQLDRGVVKIEHLTTVTQTYRDVLDIVGKDVLDRNGKLTDALNKQTYNIQRNHTHALQSQLDFIDTALEKAKGLYDEAVQNGYNQKTLESLKADVEKYEDERQATYEEWLDSWKEECQIAKDYYEDTLNQILQDFEDAVAGQFKNLSGLSEEFARKNEIADIYVEDYEKIYQLSKLNRDINKSLDDSTTLASKAKLRDIQKEINDLQESGVEVSQYDLDVLRKKYEMALAYEQWQDAQNAKTVVRMQRDNEGNYGYVYTADQADVEAAEQNYEDKLHEMQVLNAEYIQSLQEQIIQAQQDCADALANLRAEDFASYEEYQDAVEQIRKDYTKRVETLSQQMGNAMDNNRTLYEQDWTAYSQATGYKISADEDYIDKFNETVYSQLTGFQTMEEAQNAFVEAVNDASDLAAQNWEDWYVRTNTALDDAEMSMQNYADEVGDTVEQLGEEAERAEEDVWNMSEEFSDAYSTISDTVGDFLDEYSNYIDSMIDANQALIDSINQVIRAYAELHGLEDDEDEDDEVRKSEDLEWQEQKDANGVSTGWKVYDKKNKKYLTGKNKIAWAGDDYIQGYTADYDIDEQGNVKQQSENNTLGSGFFGTNFTEEQKAKLRKPTIINAEINMTDDEKKYGPSANILSENKVKNTVFEGLNDFFSGKPVGGASGMYTGDWGDNSGKIAVLHRKELVLNANDTENILSAVDMIRSISKTIDLNALAAGSIFASPNSAYKSSFGSRDSLEQNVHIQAEFPNVSDHNEIEEALNNLVERAAQFAGRKNL